MTENTSQFYSKCNLTGNPFRANPTQETDPRSNVWAGYSVERRTLKKFLTRTRSDQIGNNNFLLLYGNYGIGKSHALLWARHQILQKEKEAFNAVCYYIQTLRKDQKISFCKAFQSDIVEKSSLLDDVLNYKQFLDEAAVDYRRHRQLDHTTTKEQIVEQLFHSPEYINFVNKILDCESRHDVQTLIGSPKTDFEATNNLALIVNLFVSKIEPANKEISFKKAAYLFVDEVDLLGTATAKEARETNDLFRHVYDLCPVSFCMILAFTATAAELPILFAEYVLSRVSRQIVMELMDVDEAKEFVLKILNSEREMESRNMDYFPFTEDAVGAITSQIVSITPRKIVNAMQQILEESRLCEADPAKKPIDLDFLDKHQIIEDVLE